MALQPIETPHTSRRPPQCVLLRRASCQMFLNQDAVTRENTSDALMPPKPNELESTARGESARPRCAT